MAARLSRAVPIRGPLAPLRSAATCAGHGSACLTEQFDHLRARTLKTATKKPSVSSSPWCTRTTLLANGYSGSPRLGQPGCRDNVASGDDVGCSGARGHGPRGQGNARRPHQRPTQTEPQLLRLLQHQRHHLLVLPPAATRRGPNGLPVLGSCTLPSLGSPGAWHSERAACDAHLYTLHVL